MIRTGPPVIAICVCLTLAALVLNLAFALPARANCQGEDGGTSVVIEINAGENLILEDGRAVRLIGILTPKRARSGPAMEARKSAETAIEKLTLGKKVSLQLDKRKRDRYGRILAHVMVFDESGKQAWVQGRLVEDGLARVMSFRDNRLCVNDLLALEDTARRGEKGLWKTGFFSIRRAEAEDVLTRLARSFEIVEGRVKAVAQIRGRTYINFGENWRSDFTGFVPAKSAKLFQAGEYEEPEGFDLNQLKGKHVRIRGWMKNYNGPSITVTHPEQIEIVNNTKAMLR